MPRASYYLTNDKGNYYSGISIIFFNFYGLDNLTENVELGFFLQDGFFKLCIRIKF